MNFFILNRNSCSYWSGNDWKLFGNVIMHKNAELRLNKRLSASRMHEETSEWVNTFLFSGNEDSYDHYFYNKFYNFKAIENTVRQLELLKILKLV